MEDIFKNFLNCVISGWWKFDFQYFRQFVHSYYLKNFKY